MSQNQPDGYLARPASKTGPAVLVLHAWWGLNDTIKAFCTQLAAEGFLAFAPDLYHGAVVDTIAEAETLSGTLFANADQAFADLAGATAFLRDLAGPQEQGLAVLGFSLGASFALDLSVSAADYVHSVVLFYGTGAADYDHAHASYLGHFAASDDYEPLEGVNELEGALRAAGRAVTFYHYPDTGHWFMEPDRPQAYNPAAAGLAWDRTLAFLRRSATE